VLFSAVIPLPIRPPAEGTWGASPNATQLVLEDITTPTIQVGMILIDGQAIMAQGIGLETEPYSGTWSLVKFLDGCALDRKIRGAGWNLFFMAAEINAMFVGRIGPEKTQKALQRILAKVRPQHFNALEVTGIVAKRFLGIPYAVVSAHSRHVQQSCKLNGAAGRRAFHRDTEWART
jgi:hypothetical protein